MVLSYRVGVGIGAHGIRAVGVTRQSVVWYLEARGVDVPELADAMVALFERFPRRGWWRSSVSVAIGPSWVQVRPLTGVPWVDDETLRSSLLQENAGRFFLKNGVPLCTQLTRTLGGEIWGIAFEEPILRAVMDACRRAKIGLVAVVPAVAVVGLAVEGDWVAWPDGEVLSELTLRDHRLVAVRRLPLPAGEVPNDARPVSGLASLGAEAWRAADAFGASAIGKDFPLAIRPERRTLGLSVRVIRSSGAGLALLMATLLLTLGPSLKAVQLTRAATRELRSLASARAATVTASRELQRFTAALEETGRFKQTRLPSSLVVAGLAEALPSRSAIVELALDSLGGRIVVLTPELAALPSSLERLPWLRDPSLLGPTTRETVGGQPYDRGTLRFLWRVDPAGPKKGP